MPRPNPQVDHQGLQWRRGTEHIGDTELSSYEFKDVDPGAYDAEAYYRSYVSSNTPGLRRNPRTGRFSKRTSRGLPENSHSVYRREMEVLEYYSRIARIEATNYNATASAPPWAVRNIFASQLPDWNQIQNEAQRLAAVRLRDKVNKPKFNAGVAFAERGQTGNLIANTATRVYHAARSMRRADLRGFLNACSLPESSDIRKAWESVYKTPPSKRLANHWLEYNFGWKPLLSDVKEAAETLASHVLEENYKEDATASATIKRTVEWKPPANSLDPTVRFDYKATYRYKIKYRLDQYWRAAMAQTGIDNPALVAWELLPYSFVIDWFLPVGDYLKRLTAFSGFDLVGGSQSVRVNGTAQVMLAAAQVGSEGGMPTSVIIKGAYNRREFHYGRSPISTFPFIGWPPEFRDPFGKDPAWTFATSFALMRQEFGRDSSPPGSGKFWRA